jgi:hypothetical protein
MTSTVERYAAEKVAVEAEVSAAQEGVRAAHELYQELRHRERGATSQELSAAESLQAQSGFRLRRARASLDEATARHTLAVENSKQLGKCDALGPAAQRISDEYTAHAFKQIDALAVAAQDVAAKLQPLESAHAAIPWNVSRDLSLTRPVSPWENLPPTRVAFLERLLAIAREAERLAAPPTPATTPNAGRPWPKGFELTEHQWHPDSKTWHRQ